MQIFLTYSFSCALALIPCISTAQQLASGEKSLEQCMLKQMELSADEITLGEIRALCSQDSANRVQKRDRLEHRASLNPFALLPHKPNYLLPVTFANISKRPYEGDPKAEKYQDTEAKFQISLKYLAVEDLMWDGLDVQVAFTVASYWQAYNGEISAPFRETNYEPEIIFNYSRPWSLLGLPIEQTFVSLNHQSNGQTGELSRSWNRIIGGVVFAQNANVTWGLRTWWRIPEEDKQSFDDPDGDDNPYIERYMGYGEIGGVWSISDNHTLELLLRNNLRSDNRGAVQLGWTFPITRHLRGYVEYFNGYGESLIYYNQHTQRLGLGVKLTNWL
ncbi:phospholipase A [Paraglaciecola sp. T6c]|uniref:phospholipase A n=1 Tax=Pseudoalteromonas atlantica (strain T6c / ATCC BAA-1087) TaxID=3042615 RepID=UPI0002E51826|nr:phospholipase A [Paraglaciecola sp. T6c]